MNKLSLILQTTAVESRLLYQQFPSAFSSSNKDWQLTQGKEKESGWKLLLLYGSLMLRTEESFS